MLEAIGGDRVLSLFVDDQRVLDETSAGRNLFVEFPAVALVGLEHNLEATDRIQHVFNFGALGIGNALILAESSAHING